MRYLKLYMTYAKLSLMSKMVYKANVFIGVLAFLFGQVVSLLTLFILVGAVPHIDGYNIYQVGFLFGVTNISVVMYADKKIYLLVYENGSECHFHFR